MQLITAIIQKNKLDDVTRALEERGVGGLTITDALGHGTQKGRTQVFRGREVRPDFLPKTRLELVVDDRSAESLVTAIVQAARTGRIGDGKVWLTPVTEVVRVRTGEHGADAL